MCGLVGALAFNKTGINLQDLEVFLDLLRVSTVRGTDGTGMIYIGDKETGLTTGRKELPYSSWLKQGTNANDFMEGPLFQKALPDFTKCRFLIGHCRAATRGASSTDNAHPFEEGPILMVHNGTINIDMKKDDKSFDVDSHALCYELSKKPALEVMRDIKGPAAVIWYDRRDFKLRVYRNYERPLFACRSTNKLFIASEAWMLFGVVGRHNLNKDEVKQFETRKIYEFSHEERDPTIVEVPFSVYHPPIHQRSHHAARGGTGANDEYFDSDANEWRPLPRQHGAVFQEVQRKLELLPPRGEVVVPTKFRKRTDADLERLHRDSEKFLNSLGENGKNKAHLVPTNNYFTIEPGMKVIFEPTNLDYLDESKRRAIFNGVLREVLPMMPRPYGMIGDVRINAKTRKKPQPGMEPQQLYQQKLLVGKVESCLINHTDMSDVHINLIDVEPFKEEWMANITKFRKNAPAC